MLNNYIKIKKYIKLSLILILMFMTVGSVFGKDILIDAVCVGQEQNTCDSAKFVETMAAYHKTELFYEGTTQKYAVPTSTFISSDPNDVSWVAAPSTYNFSANVYSGIAAKDGNGFAHRGSGSNNYYYYGLPTYYSIGGLTTLFHTTPGSSYGSSGIRIAYTSYEVDELGNVKESTRKNVQTHISAGSPNFIAHQPDAEYQFKIENGLYYSYNEINITDKMKSNFQTIETPADGGIPYGGRLYISKSEMTKSDAYDYSSSHKKYDINLNTAYQMLSLPKILSSDWVDSTMSGYRNKGSYIDYNTPYYDASVVNMYDNVIQLGAKKTSTRKIYVNHYYELNGVRYKLDAYKNTYARMISPAGTQNSVASSYHESYSVKTGETIEIRKSDKDGTMIANGKFSFNHGEWVSAGTLDQAEGLATNQTFTTATKNFTVNSSNEDDVVIVNLIYKPDIIPMPIDPLTLVGRLEFINRQDSAYTSATINHDTDYIPSTKELTPYAQDAYPYVVRGIRYDTKSESGSSSATITISIDYSYQYWVFEHHDTAATPPATGTVCTSACKYYSYTGYGSLSKSYTYTVPYKHTYFDITNFKMYRISKLEVYDDSSNKGGTLFGGGTYTITPSSTYNSRFNSSQGKVDDHITVTFPGSSYSLTSVYKSAASPGSGESAAKSAAQASLDAVTAKIAADHQSLTITYDYDNDYVNLDGLDDMLQRNNKNWSEHITAETNTERDLDSTKSGTGQVNGSTINYSSNLMSFMKPTRKLTTDSDFSPNYQKVPVNRENGERILRGKIYYSLVTDSKYNVGTDSFWATDATYKVRNTYPIEMTTIDSSALGVQTKDYVIDTTKGVNDVNKVNVFTPLKFDEFEVETTEKVDHTDSAYGAGSSTILQKNAEFSIDPNPGISRIDQQKYSVDTTEFFKGYIFVFDFNIIYNGHEVLAYTPVYATAAEMPFKAKTTDSFGSGAAAQLSNSIKVVGVSTNIPDAVYNQVFNEGISDYKYIDLLSNITRITGVQNEIGLLSRNDIINDAYHAIYKRLVTKNVGRIFDFAITDCTDLSYKNVFRDTTTGDVNKHTGIYYYSGTKRWDFNSADEYNKMVDRTDVGTAPQRILPLGPYKNTDTRYVNAPKMGYRISFDLKTTGFMQNNNSDDSRVIQITPKYYYISKDGKTFDNNIKLYYQNSSGNYVTFANSGYSIYFKPNDGYRYLRNQYVTDSINFLSSKLEKLDVSSVLTLGSKEMTTNNTSFIQAWYGEFKLPNSTIAISNVSGNTHNNLNNPYTDGYIGVIFDIKCIDKNGFFTLSYNTDDKSAPSRTNTSQWDYEGYMNFSTPGSPAGTLKYQLEKDVWFIDNNMYQKIKGTVVLYDIDNRAADDFE